MCAQKARLVQRYWELRDGGGPNDVEGSSSVAVWAELKRHVLEAECPDCDQPEEAAVVCSERVRLRKAHAHAVGELSDRMQDLKNARATDAFDAALQHADSARQASQSARLDLDRHVAIHGCAHVTRML